MRELIVFVLNEAGYHVTVTEDSADALLLARQNYYDLILVDNWMPGLSGQDLTREVRRFNQRTPILFYSGAALESDKLEARDAGAQGYLIKPLGIAHLVDEVARLIDAAEIAFPVADRLGEIMYEPWDLQRQMCRQTMASCEKQQQTLAEQRAMLRRQQQSRVYTRPTSQQTPEIDPDNSAAESTNFQSSTIPPR